MVFKTILSLWFLFLLFGAACLGSSSTEGSELGQKTVKSGHGDIYDCVDFYKQPAFDHPLLKNHSFYPEMMSTFLPQVTESSGSFWKINATEADMIRLKDGGCPQGTVPIRRMKKSSGLSGAKLHPKLSSKAINLNGATDYVSGTIFALSQTKSDPRKVYNGVGSVVTVYKPRALESQYSSAELILKGGTDSITVGWTVNIKKNPDFRTRFFVYTVGGDSRCYNTQCGFVQLAKELPVDFVMSPVSKRGGQIYVIKILIFRDMKNGNWFLQLGSDKPFILGYWPRSFFSGLQHSATYAAVGGEIFTPATMPPPEMGAGLLPFQLANDDAFFTEFVVVDETNTVVKAGDTEIYANNDNYNAIDQFGNDHKVLFGGPL